jgi:hypothetical protein
MPQLEEFIADLNAKHNEAYATNIEWRKKQREDRQKATV